MSTARLPRRPVAPKPTPAPAPEPATVADLLARLGGVPAKRVRWTPRPGTATERDLVISNEILLRTALCELVEGTLVEKPVGFEESEIASLIIGALVAFVYPRRLGAVLSPDGMLRLAPGLVRLPDVSFVARPSYPDGKKPREAIAPLAPDLAIEVLSRSNTKKEMERKLREYFGAGSRLVWLVDPRKQNVRIYTAPDQFQMLTIDDELDGGDVLPGFRLAIRGLFERD